MRSLQHIGPAQVRAVAFITLLTGIIGCTIQDRASGDATTDTAAAPSAAPVAAETIHGITVRDAWARIADSAATGGAYITLVNGNSTPVEIVGAASASADAVEIHETSHHDGMAHMSARPSIVIAPGDSLVMAPGGLHVMLIGLHSALKAGDRVPLVVQLATGDLVPLTIPVRVP
ncbi:MAG TPA: copper chaperone PCu(A)C [Gemmatimonas sp.]|uniref:copper chaperone PCu(A)C n=1 Tax=Gemmatimonas sp. TaxID=1962908 RepID=UPI002EDA3CAF